MWKRYSPEEKLARETYVVRRRLFEGATFAQIGRELGVQRERPRQIFERRCRMARGEWHRMAMIRSGRPM